MNKLHIIAAVLAAGVTALALLLPPKFFFSSNPEPVASNSEQLSMPALAADDQGASDRRGSPVISAEQSGVNSTPAVGEKQSSANEEARAYFASANAQRLASATKLTAAAVLAVLPPEFCNIYPDECALMRMSPELTLLEILGPPPSEAELHTLFEDEVVASLWAENEGLSALGDKLADFITREAEYRHGQAPATTIFEFLGDNLQLIDASFEDPQEFLALVEGFGQAVAESWVNAEQASLQGTQIEQQMLLILWRERARRENRLFAQLQPRDAFWWHASRVTSRHFYDDSYWVPADETFAGESDAPYFLER